MQGEPVMLTVAEIYNNSHSVRVAECYVYGGYIRVKKLEGWGKKWERTCNFAKLGSFEVYFSN